MFPWMFNYIATDPLSHILYEQNEILTQIATHLNTIANDHSGEWSFWSSLIIGLVAVWTAFQQSKISKRQHNLELFDKRWALLEELRILGNEYFDFPHSAAPEETVNNPKKNYCLFDNKMLLFNNKAFVIMGKETYEELEKLRKKCMEYHQIQEEYWQVKKKLKFWDEVYKNKIESKEELQQQETNLTKEIGTVQLKTYDMWNNIYKIFLYQIQNREIE